MINLLIDTVKPVQHRLRVSMSIRVHIRFFANAYLNYLDRCVDRQADLNYLDWYVEVKIIWTILDCKVSGLLLGLKNF